MFASSLNFKRDAVKNSIKRRGACRVSDARSTNHQPSFAIIISHIKLFAKVCVRGCKNYCCHLRAKLAIHFGYDGRDQQVLSFNFKTILPHTTFYKTLTAIYRLASKAMDYTKKC